MGRKDESKEIEEKEAMKKDLDPETTGDKNSVNVNTAGNDSKTGVPEEVDVREDSIKTEIGKRFRKFREEIGKPQHELAAELGIYQSTITNIERGKTFPNIRYLQYFYAQYDLNINWLLTNEGEMRVQEYQINPSASSVMECHVAISDPRYDKYKELMNYMKVFEVEQIVLSRLIEAKVMFKDEIRKYFSGLEMDSPESEDTYKV